MPITDAEAKRALRAWPGVGAALWPGSVPGAAWLRAQPVVGAGPAPRLYQAGSNHFSTQPDGLYVCLAPAPEDAFADERTVSRYELVAAENAKVSTADDGGRSLLSARPARLGALQAPTMSRSPGVHPSAL